jgi:hypothetical protein
MLNEELIDVNRQPLLVLGIGISSLNPCQTHLPGEGQCPCQRERQNKCQIECQNRMSDKTSRFASSQPASFWYKLKMFFFHFSIFIFVSKDYLEICFFSDLHFQFIFIFVFFLCWVFVIPTWKISKHMGPSKAVRLWGRNWVHLLSRCHIECQNECQHMPETSQNRCQIEGQNVRIDSMPERMSECQKIKGHIHIYIYFQMVRHYVRIVFQARNHYPEESHICCPTVGWGLRFAPNP